ncbi:Replication factor C, subunit RFC4 [Rhizina undulata]
MKVLTKEEEDDHYRQVLRGGFSGCALGLGLGLSSAIIAHKKWAFFRSLTLPLKAFYVSSAATFGAIIEADRFSRQYEASRHQIFDDSTKRAIAEAEANMTTYEKLMKWGKDNRYTIVTTSWALSMAVSLGLVSRNKYLTTSQKLVQARMYAQGLTLLVLIASAGFEVADAKKGEGRYETIKIVDPNDPAHKHYIEKKIHHERYSGEDLWKDMIEAEEKRLQMKKQAEESQNAAH